MTAELVLPPSRDRRQLYEAIIPQVRSVIETETDAIANMANVSAILKATFGFLWVGFYRFDGKELVLGPFQGSVACTRIPLDKGVCGHSASIRQTVIVPDVDKFPGHIACSSVSRSEIVVPLIAGDRLLGVLDADSELLDYFSEVDRTYLEEVSSWLASAISSSDNFQQALNS